MLDRLKTVLPAYGQAYSVRWRLASTSNERGKREADYRAFRKPPADADFLNHFAGKAAINMQPILDHPDFSGKVCQWAAIDVDTYGAEGLADRLKKQLDAIGLRSFVEPSKSGGAHVYFVFSQPLMAAGVRNDLRKVCRWLGLPDSTTELRPAQNEVDFSAGDLGNMMVLPGFGQPVEEVVEALEAAVMSPQEFANVTSEGELADGPPCLYPLVLQGRVNGWTNRNKFAYQLAVFFKHKYPGEFRERVHAYIEEAMGDEALDAKEINQVLDSVEKNKKYHYICTGSPFADVCNKQLCQVRKFGIGMKGSVSTVVSEEGITKLDTDPPTWFMTIKPAEGEAKRVKLTTQQLFKVTDFKKRCLEETLHIPTMPKQEDWEKYLSQVLKKAHVIPVPFEMTEAARVLDATYRFCLSSPKTSDKEGLLRGRVLAIPTDTGIIAKFRLVDFANFIDRSRIKGLSAAELYSVMSELERLGKAHMHKMEIPPHELDVWSLEIESQYMRIQTEMDLEKV